MESQDPTFQGTHSVMLWHRQLTTSPQGVSDTTVGATVPIVIVPSRRHTVNAAMIPATNGEVKPILPPPKHPLRALPFNSWLELLSELSSLDTPANINFPLLRFAISPWRIDCALG